MSVGFRKSLFGFNSQDVMEYIDRNHRSFAKKEDELNTKISELTSLLEHSRNEQEKLELEKTELNKKLDSFNEKYEEIERLSENIGKLYLVAQSNAQAIINNAKNEAKIAEEEVNKNIVSIDETHNALAELKADIIRTSEEFSAKVDTLVNSLTNAREKIAVDSNLILENSENFDKVYSSIVE